MNKSHTIKRSAKSGRFVAKSLGKSKATKFSLVEGITLNSNSSKTIRNLETSGLKGDGLRHAITGSFMRKRG